jgi:hypothetical protein
LEDSNSSFLVEITNSWALCVHCANSLRLVVLQGIAEAFVEFQGNDRLGKLIEVSSQDVGGIVYSVPCPVQSLAVTIGRIERNFELLDTLLATRKTEDTLDVGRCFVVRKISSCGCTNICLPFSLRNTPHFATTIGT